MKGERRSSDNIKEHFKLENIFKNYVRVANQPCVPAAELVAFVKDLLELEKLKDKSGEKESSSTSSSVASSCPLLENQTPGLLTRPLKVDPCSIIL